MIEAIGATDELSLRVSVATLVRVLFKNPGDGEWMLALERKATLHETGNDRAVRVTSQPFGGAIRILDMDALRDVIGDYHFDSERSRAERDFRIFIRPTGWPALREFCLQHIDLVDDPILESDPKRELSEEFTDTLQINLQPEQYVCTPLATFPENEAAPTENIYATGSPTVRIYRIYEASITDPSLAHLMLNNSASLSHQDLCKLALEDARHGGKGRANAIVALPWNHIQKAYQATPPNERSARMLFGENILPGTSSSLLALVIQPNLQRGVGTQPPGTR